MSYCRNLYLLYVHLDKYEYHQEKLEIKTFTGKRYNFQRSKNSLQRSYVNVTQINVPSHSYTSKPEIVSIVCDDIVKGQRLLLTILVDSLKQRQDALNRLQGVINSFQDDINKAKEVNHI